MIPAGSSKREAALSYVSYAGSSNAQTNMVPLLNVSDAGLAPANPKTNADNLPESVQRGAEIVLEAAGVTPFYVLAVPEMMWNKTGHAIGYFLQNPWDVETTLVMMEEARLEALAAGEF